MRDDTCMHVFSPFRLSTGFWRPSWILYFRKLVFLGIFNMHFRTAFWVVPEQIILPYQVWPSDYQSDLDNRCVWSGYENEGCEQHEYSLWRHRFTDCSVEVTLRSDCLGRLNKLWIGQGGGGRRGVLNSIAHIRVIKVLPVADNCIDEDGTNQLITNLFRNSFHLGCFVVDL